MTTEELELMKKDIEIHEEIFRQAGERLSSSAGEYEFADRALGRAKREYEAALAESAITTQEENN